MIKPIDAAAVQAAAQVLADGGLVAFPTETVYGLGARADDDAAVHRIFAAKGRPSDHPLIVHVAEAEGALAFVDEVPPLADKLMKAFWPGPLTVIVPRREGVGAAAAGGQNTIGLRCPDHPWAQALLRAAKDLGVLGVAAPSANQFGRVSPTLAAHVREEFGADLMILDGGACRVGIESTIVDCSRGRAVLLRPGTITQDAIEAVLGQAVDQPDEQAPRASGTLVSHYAPRAKVRLMSSAELRSLLEIAGDSLAEKTPSVVAVYSRTVQAPAGLLSRRMPMSPEAAAFELFAVLRDLDAQGVQLIWVEMPPDDVHWLGVRDRLTRAAA